jgi:3-oxoacyl-[acyl-carrier protein] reductase
MDLGIAGRACVVTGGCRGIGLETARLLRAEDAKVLLVARDAGQLAEAAEGLDGGEEEIATLPLDLTEPDAGEQMLGAALAAFDGIDALVNSAGAARPRDAFEASDADWRAEYELHVKAPIRAMKAIAPVLAERGWGRIVNVMPEHSVAKAAELSLSRLFAERFVADGVLINGIVPAADADTEEIASTIVFLCSERASYVAGAAWPVAVGTARVTS